MSAQAESLEDIREQEESIFEELDRYEPTSRQNFSVAREKAQRQLALSSDSPFSYIQEDAGKEAERSRNIRDQRAAMLVEETLKIRNQLDEIKNRLAEIRNAKGSPSAQNSKPQTLPKFRPLTGKADCPNCTCDRRSSVCDKCVNLATVSGQNTSKKLSNSKPDPSQNYLDDRPIRPALTTRFQARVEPAPIERNLIPNQVFTISRSLDNKRTKLAQAIDVLQLEINKVKERGNRAEKERKLAQLYKSQWKFGPTVGGPRASGRDRLGKDQQSQSHDYRSRLDPNLRRDAKSLMGFRHIGSDLKLRQYNSGSSTNLRDRRLGPKTNLQPRLTSTRSRSLESLATERPPIEAGRNSPKLPVHDLSKVQSSSNKSLAMNKESDPDEAEVVEELEDCLDAKQSSSDNGSSDERQSVIEPTKVDQDQLVSSTNESVQKMSWVPVFGETEIKTIKKTPKRKLQIISPPSSASAKVAGNALPRSTQPTTRAKAQLGLPKSILSSREKPSPLADNRQDRLLTEAEKKLKFASDLLAQEKVDSKTKNQLLVNQSTPIPKPRRTTVKSVGLNASSQDEDEPRSVPVRQELNHADTELHRLEEMVNEQQRLLNRLVASQSGRQSPAIVSPITVSCPSPCCCNRGCRPESAETGTNKSSLVIALKDRLNKTKLRLAKRLEEERERHQQLQLKVDSSLRKQTDLETENEILKQSLSKCIDTCLKDISSTFESIADTLSSSIGPKASSSAGEQVMPLNSAAQLITENRYLKDMQRHVETLEEQRRDIFDELSKEKQRAAQLETHLRQSQTQLEHLSAYVKDKLNCPDESQSLGLCDSTQEQVDSRAAGSSRPIDETTTDDKSQSDETLTYSSAGEYRQYIKTISPPDMEAIKRERQLLLDEFDNMRKLLPSIEEW